MIKEEKGEKSYTNVQECSINRCSHIFGISCIYSRTTSFFLMILFFFFIHKYDIRYDLHDLR